MRIQLVGSSTLMDVLNGPLQSVPVQEWPPFAQELRTWFQTVVTIAVQVMQETLIEAWFKGDGEQADRASAYLDITVAPDRSHVSDYRITYKHPEHSTVFNVTGTVDAERVAKVTILESPLQ